MVEGTVTPNENGTVRWTAARACTVCTVPVAVDQLDPAAVEAWQGGAMAQDVFPGMSASEREALVSGTHAQCFEALFADDDDDFPEYELP